MFSAFDTVYDTGSNASGLVIGCDSSGCDGSNYPFIELSRMARRLKLDHPGDRSVVIQTTSDVQVQHFVSALDALRDDGLTGRHRVDLFSDPIYDITDPKP